MNPYVSYRCGSDTAISLNCIVKHYIQPAK